MPVETRETGGREDFGDADIVCPDVALFCWEFQGACTRKSLSQRFSGGFGMFIDTELDSTVQRAKKWPENFGNQPQNQALARI